LSTGCSPTTPVPEHTLGVRLLDRNPHGVKLTEFGRAMLNRSHAAFDELRQGVKDIEFLSDPGVGEVRIGSTGPLAASFVSAVIERLQRRYPRMVFRVDVQPYELLRRELHERNLDLLVLRKIGAFAEDALSFEVLYDNPYFVTAGADSPWVRRRHIELADLINEMWVLPPLDSRFGTLVRDIFGAKALPCPRVAVIAHGLEVTINLLRTGRYLSIQPESGAHVPREASVHQETAGRVANRQRTNRNCYAEGPSAQSGRAAVHRNRPRGRQAAGKERQVITMSVCGTSATSRNYALESALWGEADHICSHRVFLSLTLTGNQPD